MSPIEEHLIRTITRELATLGVSDASVTVLSAEAENWRYRIAARGREIEVGFNHHEQLWCRETTPSAQKQFISNDQPRIGTSDAALATGLRLVGRAFADPTFAVKDPPVI